VTFEWAESRENMYYCGSSICLFKTNTNPSRYQF